MTGPQRFHGGVKIGDTTYDVEIVAFDDQKDPKRAIAGMEKMAQEGIHRLAGGEEVAAFGHVAVVVDPAGQDRHAGHFERGAEGVADAAAVFEHFLRVIAGAGAAVQ